MRYISNKQKAINSIKKKLPLLNIPMTRKEFVSTISLDSGANKKPIEDVIDDYINTRKIEVHGEFINLVEPITLDEETRKDLEILEKQDYNKN